ncbi:hypothetical protein Tco_0872721, partial [Tanacetum coccineum]
MVDGMYAADMSANGRGDIIRRAIILDLMRRFADVVDAKDIGLGICKRNNISTRNSSRDASSTSCYFSYSYLYLED